MHQRVTKPRIFDEAFHFRARQGTKDRIDGLRGSMRQGDFIRLLIEEALDRREADGGQPEDATGLSDPASVV